MKVFNNPHFQNQAIPSQSMRISRCTLSQNNQRLSKSQALDMPQQHILTLQLGTIEEQQSELDNEQFIEKLQRLSHTQPKEVEEKDQLVVNKKVNLNNQIDRIKQLRAKVLGMLYDYNQNLLKLRENRQIMNTQGKQFKDLMEKEAKKIKNKIQEDTYFVEKEYDSILQEIVQCDLDKVNEDKKQEQENDEMFNLLEEFLQKFSNRKPQLNLYTTLKQEKIEQSNYQSEATTDNLQRSSFYDFNQNPFDTFLGISVEQAEFQEKGTLLAQLNTILENIRFDLQKLMFYNNDKNILNFGDIVNQAMNQTQTSALTILIQKLESLLSVKDTQKYQNLILKTKKTVHAKIELLLKLQLTSNRLSVSLQQQQALRRRFFKVALELKKQLPPNHIGKNILVAELYEDCQVEGIDESQWNGWIKQQLKCQ